MRSRYVSPAHQAQEGRQGAPLLEHRGESPDRRRGRVVQRPLLYLGEINDSQELAWRKSIAILEEGALPPSRKGTRWDRVLLLLATYRLLAPGSEWRLHREWFERSAMADLLGEDLGLAEIPSCIAVTTGCSNTSRPCSIIWSGAGATCSTSASMCCSTI